MIKKLYTNIEIPKNINDNINCTYGEILPSSIKKIFNHINLYNKTFLDIGSGLGKIVLQVAIDYPIKKSYGIEICQNKYLISNIVKNKLNQNLQDKIIFYNEDIFNCQFLYYDIILFSNICFNEKQNNKIANLIRKNKNIILICLKKIDILQNYLKYYLNNIETSWSSNTTAYYYYL